MWKGTLFHEVLHLPAYLLRAAQAQRVPYTLSTHTYGPHARQYFQVLCPPTPPTAWIVYWHGGSWQFGSPERFHAAAYHWLAQGYGVIMPSYRRIPRFNYRDIREDTVTCLRLAREAVPGGINLPFVFMGMSAGGHIAALAATDRELRAQIHWATGQIVGCIPMGGVLNLNAFWLHPTMIALAGVPTGELYQLANPFNHLQGDECPLLVIHGTKDGMVGFKGIEQYCAKYESLNPAEKLQLITIPDGTHLDAGVWLYSQNEVQRQVQSVVASWVTA
ncbi:MAG: alpha/beta hydrolase fold domain-containing protein [Bacteroidota bacterium]